MPIPGHSMQRQAGCGVAGAARGRLGGQLHRARCTFSIYTHPDSGDPAVVAIDYGTSDLVLTDPTEVTTPYDQLYARLRSGTAPADSLDLLTKAATELPD